METDARASVGETRRSIPEVDSPSVRRNREGVDIEVASGSLLWSGELVAIIVGVYREGKGKGRGWGWAEGRGRAVVPIVPLMSYAGGPDTGLD